MVLQHAVSLARVCEDPSGGLIVVKRGPWGSGGELLKERRARHRLGGCLPGGLCRPTAALRWRQAPLSPSRRRKRGAHDRKFSCYTVTAADRLRLQTVLFFTNFHCGGFR